MGTSRALRKPCPDPEVSQRQPTEGEEDGELEGRAWELCLHGDTGVGREPGLWGGTEVLICQLSWAPGSLVNHMQGPHWAVLVAPRAP